MSCLKPIVIRNSKGQLQSVPCNKCPGCYYTKVGGMTFRLLQEERVSDSAHFITMTYGSDNLVTTPYGRASLSKYDLQNFFKRLRKAHGNKHHLLQPIKYYAVGEYGTKSSRPHYHSLVFNCDIDKIESAWRVPGSTELIGDIYYGDVNSNSVGYTLKYMAKPRYAGLFGDDDRHPEFAINSNGIGLSYLTKNMIAWHKADLHNRRYVELPGGVKVAMPRYLYEKLYDGYERDLLSMSGSLISQDEFYKQFTSVSYDTRMQELHLFNKRVEAAFTRHHHNTNKIALL